LENDIETFTQNLDVPEKGVFHVSGLAKSLEDAERIPEIIRKTAGVKKVGAEVRIRAASI
jgi:osmotically-inducible protein OsmY